MTPQQLMKNLATLLRSYEQANDDNPVTVDLTFEVDGSSFEWDGSTFVKVDE